MREHHKKWEGTRDKRINSWRDFASNKKAKKAKPLGGIKPPKLKVPCNLRLIDCLTACICGAMLCTARIIHNHAACISECTLRQLAFFPCCRWRMRIAPTFSDQQWSSLKRLASLLRPSMHRHQLLCWGPWTCHVHDAPSSTTAHVLRQNSKRDRLNVMCAVLQAAPRRGLKGCTCSDCCTVVD
jgi:hypothetical protein